MYKEHDILKPLPNIRRIAIASFQASQSPGELVAAAFDNAQQYRQHLVRCNDGNRNINLLQFYQGLESATADFLFRAPDWFDLSNVGHMASLRMAQIAHELGAGVLVAEHLMCLRHPGRGYVAEIASPRRTTFHALAGRAMQELIANCNDEEKARRQLHLTKALGQLKKLIKVLLACIENDVLYRTASAQSWSWVAYEHAHWDYLSQKEKSHDGSTLPNTDEPPAPPHWQLIDEVVALSRMK